MMGRKAFRRLLSVLLILMLNIFCTVAVLTVFPSLFCHCHAVGDLDDPPMPLSVNETRLSDTGQVAFRGRTRLPNPALTIAAACSVALVAVILAGVFAQGHATRKRRKQMAEFYTRILRNRHFISPHGKVDSVSLKRRHPSGIPHVKKLTLSRVISEDLAPSVSALFQDSAFNSSPIGDTREATCTEVSTPYTQRPGEGDLKLEFCAKSEKSFNSRAPSPTHTEGFTRETTTPELFLHLSQSIRTQSSLPIFTQDKNRPAEDSVDDDAQPTDILTAERHSSSQEGNGRRSPVSLLRGEAENDVCNMDTECDVSRLSLSSVSDNANPSSSPAMANAAVQPGSQPNGNCEPPQAHACTFTHERGASAWYDTRVESRPSARSLPAALLNRGDTPKLLRKCLRLKEHMDDAMEMSLIREDDRRRVRDECRQNGKTAGLLLLHSILLESHKENDFLDMLKRGRSRFPIYDSGSEDNKSGASNRTSMLSEAGFTMVAAPYEHEPTQRAKPMPVEIEDLMSVGVLSPTQYSHLVDLRKQRLEQMDDEVAAEILKIVCHHPDRDPTTD
eukprot:scpid61541/ scgid24305/ 